MFDLKTYNEEYMIRNLMEDCKSGDASFVIDDPYRLKINITALNHKLQQLDRRAVHQRRQLINRLFWVCCHNCSNASLRNDLLTVGLF
jgi:hypothetical protein